MNAEVAAFLDSLKSGIPPAAAAPILRAVWHGLRGEWEAAHQIAQDAMRLIRRRPGRAVCPGRPGVGLGFPAGGRLALGGGILHCQAMKSSQNDSPDDAG
jgi:hypothetical protein